MKKTLRKINIGLSDQHKHNDYKIDESQDSKYNSKTNPDKMKDLNIGSN